MPQIIGFEEQKKALKDITAKIKEIEVINKFLETDNESNEYVISCAGKKVTIICDDKSNVDMLVSDYKSRLSKEITDLAAKNSIELLEEDKQILGID